MFFRKSPMGKDSLEVKTIVKVKSLRIIAATAGRFYESVSMFLEKRKKSLVVAPKWFNNGFWRVYSSIYVYIRQKDSSVSWYNLHKEHNGVKELFKKKQFFLYWMRHRWYQSNTCVEHTEQVMDKSLINSTNSIMKLLYFLHRRVVYCKYCKKYMRKSNQATFNFWSNLWICQLLTSQYR